MHWDYDSWSNLFKKGRIYKFSNLSEIFGDNLTKSDKARIFFLVINGDYVTNIDNFNLIVRAIGGLTTLIEKEQDSWEIDTRYIVKCLHSFLHGKDLNYENLLTSAKFAKGLYDNQTKTNLIQTLINFTERAKDQKNISLDERNYLLSLFHMNN